MTDNIDDDVWILVVRSDYLVLEKHMNISHEFK